METTLGAIMLPNELLLLEGIVGMGVLGWLMLMFTQVVLLDNLQSELADTRRMLSDQKAKISNETFKLAA